MSGPELTLVIERLAAGGDGVARAADGRVVFVPWTAPGDRVRARVVLARKRFLHASLLEVLRPGADRVEPPCAAFGRCGGCSWQHLSYPAQLAAKREILRDALLRIGHLALPEAPAFLGSPDPYAYRSRARLVMQAGRLGYRRAHSQALCPVEACPVLAPPLQQELSRLVRDPPAEARGEWEIAVGDEGGVRGCVPGPGSGPRLRLHTPGGPLGVSPGVFFQANRTLRGELARRVVEAAGTGELALELYAGAGFFSLALARRFTHLLVVESSAAAVQDLRANLSDARLADVEVHEEDVLRALQRRRVRDCSPDCVVLDPPRGGLSTAGALALAKLRPPRVVYVSCDPATLARDLALLVAEGLALESVEGFDLFPHTPHVEALAVLQRPTP